MSTYRYPDANTTANPPAGADPEDAPNTPHVVVRLAAANSHPGTDLQALARAAGLSGLEALLADHDQLRTDRLIRHAPPENVRAREHLASSSRFPPIHTLTDYWRIHPTGGSDVPRLLAALAALPEVGVAYLESAVREASDGATDENPYEKEQTFLGASPIGIGAFDAWKTNRGTRVNVIDLEAGWILDHEDLPAPHLLYGDNGMPDYVSGNHGAACLGIIGGVNNRLGIIGVAPDVASLNVVSHYDAAKKQGLHVADAIDAATRHLAPGDILLVEVQRTDEAGLALPVETDSADLHAIRLATAQGIVVIEAAGNGGSNLDAWTDPNGEHSLDRTSPRFVDSGAIMVASANAAVTDGPDGRGHSRYYTSNYGSRIDVYAWGQNICTTGYGDLAGATAKINCYTRSFGQTSGAAAIIAGAAVVVQAWHKSTLRIPLTPEQMQSLLADPSNGTPQTDSSSDRIGTMPDIGRIVAVPATARKRMQCLARRIAGGNRDPYRKYRVRR